MLGALVTGTAAITGHNSFTFGSDGSNIEEAGILDRIINGVLFPFLVLGAYGIRNRLVYGWWIVFVVFGLGVIGLFANVRFALNEEDVFFQAWIIISQTLCGIITLIFLFRWWIPKREEFEQ